MLRIFLSGTIESVITDNPFGCVGYTGADGVPVDPVVRNREHYTAKVNFLDGEGKRVGNVSLQSPTIAAFEANAAEVLDNAALATAMGGEAVRNGPGPCSITAGLPRNSGTGCEGQTAGEGAGSDSTYTDRETHLSLSTKVQQNTHTVPNTGSRVGACAGVCEIRNVGIDLMTSSPGGGNTDRAPFNRHLSDIACYNMLKTGAKREPALQEPLPGVLDHRTFKRTKVDLGRCDVCGEKTAVYRSREVQAKVCEERLPRRGKSSSTVRCEGCYARLVREWNGRAGVR